MTTLDGLWTYQYDPAGRADARGLHLEQHRRRAEPGPAVRLRPRRQPDETIINGVTTNYVTNDMNQYTQIGSTTLHL